MSVIPSNRLEEYKEKGSLYPLIHLHTIKAKPEHYVITKLDPSLQNNKVIENKSDKKINSNQSDKVQTRVQKKNKPKLEIFDGDPIPAKNAPKSMNKTEQQSSKVSIQQHTSLSPQESSAMTASIFNQIREAASTATFIENAGIHVKLRKNLSSLHVKKLTLFNIKDSHKSFIKLDSRFFHLLSYALIGKNLDIIFCFFDGTELRIAPSRWIKNGNAIHQELIKNNYTLYYNNLDVPKFQNAMHSMSAYVIDNPEFIQYWMPYYPLESN